MKSATARSVVIASHGSFLGRIAVASEPEADFWSTGFVETLRSRDLLVIRFEFVDERLQVLLHADDVVVYPGDRDSTLIELQRPYHIEELDTRFDEIAHLVAVRLGRLMRPDHGPSTIHPVIHAFEIRQNVRNEVERRGPLYATAIEVCNDESHDAAQQGPEKEGSRSPSEDLG